MKVPKVPLSADGDRVLTGPEPGPFFFPDGRVNLKDQKPVFDYFRTRDELNKRFELHMMPERNHMRVTDNAGSFVILQINSTDTEIGMVIRDALVSYHVEKARAKFNG